MTGAQPALQVFVWGAQSHVADNKQFYSSFSLNGTQYCLGDSVCLHPETESQPCYVGRVKACFCDLSPEAPEPHCIEIRWFERLTNLDARHRGQPDKERELVELEETDVNPIGCISCKCQVFRCRNYDEALKLAKGCDGVWFFSRGLYRQDTNTLVPYTDLAAGAAAGHHDSKRNNRRASASPSAPEEDVADSEDTRSCKKVRMDSARLNNGMEACDVLPGDEERTTGRRKGNNNASFLSNAQAAVYSMGAAAPCIRTCVECGATQTPQWREGPHGPKTLCNACGVRYGRQQNRAGKRCGGAGVSRAAAQHAPAGRAPAMHSCATVPTHGMAMMGHTQKTASSSGMPAMAPVLSPSSKQGVRVPSERAETSGCSQQPARPVRQAAVLAANRTAEFARTGNFPDMEEARAHAIIAASSAAVVAAAEAVAQQASCSRARRVAAGQHPQIPGFGLEHQVQGGAGTSLGHLQATAAGMEVKLEGVVEGDRLVSSHESSHNSSESAQDMVLGPIGNPEEDALQMGNAYGRYTQQQTMGQEEEEAALQVASGDFDGGMVQGVGGLSKSPTLPQPADTTGHEVTPHLKQQQQLHGGKQIGLVRLGLARHSSNSLAADGGTVDLRAVAARAALWVPSIGRYSGVLSSIEEARSALPVAVVESLEVLGRAVDKAAAEAAAADAALAAVHQVLLTRQEEAAKARSEAVDVIGQLRAMMADLVEIHPQLALQGGLQSELGCLPGLEELDDGLMDSCALLQPCSAMGGGSNTHHGGNGLPHVGHVMGDEYDDVVLGSGHGRNANCHNEYDDVVLGNRPGVHQGDHTGHHTDLEDLVGACDGARHW